MLSAVIRRALRIYPPPNISAHRCLPHAHRTLRAALFMRYLQHTLFCLAPAPHGGCAGGAPHAWRTARCGAPRRITLPASCLRPTDLLFCLHGCPSGLAHAHAPRSTDIPTALLHLVRLSALLSVDRVMLLLAHASLCTGKPPPAALEFSSRFRRARGKHRHAHWLPVQTLMFEQATHWLVDANPYCGRDVNELSPANLFATILYAAIHYP